MSNNTNQTYEIYAPNGQIVIMDKKTNLIIGKENNDSKYRKIFSKAVLKAHEIKNNSPYKDYKPIYLDPNDNTNLKYFNEWKNLYLTDPKKGMIAPWTKEEKAYYESLDTKTKRCKYLIIRSGLRSATIDIPYDAICSYEDEEKFKKYEYIFEAVEKNRGSLKSRSIGNEWELSSLILGNLNAKPTAAKGFNARAQQALYLTAQLGDKESFKSLGYEVLCSNSMINGLHQNKIRAQMIFDLEKIHHTLVDEFGMIPYLDEIIGVDWVYDFNNYPFADDPDNDVVFSLYKRIDEGKLKDPRDIDSTPESRWEFLKYAYGRLQYASNYTQSPANDWTEEEVRLYIDSLILEANLAALTPPQGYPNAPFYFALEHIKDIHKRGRLDKLLNPTTPAIDRYHFPQYLRDEIYAHARKIGLR